MNLWLDDIRPMPPDFDVHVKTANEAIDYLRTGKVKSISLDHDLGLEEVVGTGYKVAMYIEKMAFLGAIPKLNWSVHSANPVGVKKMIEALKRADTYWSRT